MTPQIPSYLLTFDLSLRPLVPAIALGLIWMGSVHMKAPAQSPYATAGVLSAALIAWLVLAQYLGSTNAYFGQCGGSANRTARSAPPTRW